MCLSFVLRVGAFWLYLFIHSSSKLTYYTVIVTIDINVAFDWIRNRIEYSVIVLL